MIIDLNGMETTVLPNFKGGEKEFGLETFQAPGNVSPLGARDSQGSKQGARRPAYCIPYTCVA